MNSNLLLLIAVLGWGLAGAFQKLAVARISSPFAILIFYAVTFLFTAAYCLVSPPVVRWNGGVVWAGLAAMVSASASIAFITLIRARDVSVIIGITACNPLVTFLVAIVFLGEQFTFAKFIGILFVLLGILILR